VLVEAVAVHESAAVAVAEAGGPAAALRSSTAWA
jgi:hypothetical protein